MKPSWVLSPTGAGSDLLRSSTLCWPSPSGGSGEPVHSGRPFHGRRLRLPAVPASHLVDAVLWHAQPDPGPGRLCPFPLLRPALAHIHAARRARRPALARLSRLGLSWGSITPPSGGSTPKDAHRHPAPAHRPIDTPAGSPSGSPPASPSECPRTSAGCGPPAGTRCSAPAP